MSSRKRLLPLGAARAPRLVPQAAQLRLHRADQRGDRHLRARARLPEDLRARLLGGRRRRRLRLHRLRPRLARVRRGDRRGARTPLDGDRARRRPHQRPRAARRDLRRDRRARRPHLLAQPGAEALLELRRLGDGGLRALLRRRLRVLDDEAPGELRQRDRRRGADRRTECRAPTPTRCPTTCPFQRTTEPADHLPGGRAAGAVPDRHRGRIGRPRRRRVPRGPRFSSSIRGPEGRASRCRPAGTWSPERGAARPRAAPSAICTGSSPTRAWRCWG